jgi:hypothetical protein
VKRNSADVVSKNRPDIPDNRRVRRNSLDYESAPGQTCKIADALDRANTWRIGQPVARSRLVTRRRNSLLILPRSQRSQNVGRRGKVRRTDDMTFNGRSG